jgi:hypothetical protein
VGRSVWLEVGARRYAVEADHLPPVGTTIPVHKHVDAGQTREVEVTALSWVLEEPAEPGGRPRLEVLIRTRSAPSARRPAPAPK